MGDSHTSGDSGIESENVQDVQITPRVEQIIKANFTCTVTIKTRKVDNNGNVLEEQCEVEETTHTKSFHPNLKDLPRKRRLIVTAKLTAEQLTLDGGKLSRTQAQKTQKIML